MNISRAVIVGVAGGALAAWFAAASTSSTRPAVLPANTRTAAVDKSGAELAAEIGRLHERLHPTVAPETRSRDLFEFGAARAPRVAAVAVPAPVEAAPAPVLPLPLSLVGEAEDSGVRTAIISGLGQLFLVKIGEPLADRYTVVRIEPGFVELRDAAAGPDAAAGLLTLSLK